MGPMEGSPHAVRSPQISACPLAAASLWGNRRRPWGHRKACFDGVAGCHGVAAGTAVAPSRRSPQVRMSPCNRKNPWDRPSPGAGGTHLGRRPALGSAKPSQPMPNQVGQHGPGRAHVGQSCPTSGDPGWPLNKPSAHWISWGCIPSPCSRLSVAIDGGIHLSLPSADRQFMLKLPESGFRNSRNKRSWATKSSLPLSRTMLRPRSTACTPTAAAFSQQVPRRDRLALICFMRVMKALGALEAPVQGGAMCAWAA